LDWLTCKAICVQILAPEPSLGLVLHRFMPLMGYVARPLVTSTQTSHHQDIFPSSCLPVFPSKHQNVLPPIHLVVSNACHPAGKTASLSFRSSAPPYVFLTHLVSKRTFVLRSFHATRRDSVLA